jgi:hypothetical protein
MSESPVTMDGARVILDVQHMEVGKQYPITWRGDKAVAVKEQSGEVTFSKVPSGWVCTCGRKDF